MTTTLSKKSFRSNAVKVVALLWVTFQLYMVFFMGMPAIVTRAVHVAFACSIVFLTKPLSKEDRNYAFTLDMLFSLFYLVAAVFVLYNGDRYGSRMAYIDKLSIPDIIIGITFVILLVESCRRVLGLAMTFVAIGFIIYVFFGASLPGILEHRGIDFKSFIELQFMTTNGVFSTPTGVSTNTVFYFMLFGAFLSATPAGKLFMSLAKFATRKSKGGEGKTTIIACGLFGMISGSASANVATTGMLTYSSMEEAGFKPIFAASVLAIAGAGGQLIPPIMGAAAFLMADFIGISYFSVVLYAIIPAALYILSIYMLVHFEAEKCDIAAKKVDIEELKRQIKNYFYLIVPLIMLVVLIANGKSLMNAAVLSLILLIVLCELKKESRLSFKDIIDTLIKGALSAVVVAVPCAIAGIVVGVLTHTGLGLKISAIIASMAGGNLLIALALSMVMVIILGMGMPTSASYIMSAVVLAPALIKIGIQPIVAHMFIFYFANLSMLTPPVALASYTAAGIAKTPFWETGMKAFRLSAVIFLIPYVFVYNPALLGIGSISQIAFSIVITVAGLISIAIAVIGFCKHSVSNIMRGILIADSILLIIPNTMLNTIGLVIFGASMYLLKKAETKSIKTV